MPWVAVGDGDSLDMGQIHPVSQTISSFEHHCTNDLGSCGTNEADGGRSEDGVCGDGGMSSAHGDDGAHDGQRDRDDEHADHAAGGTCDGGACRMHGDQDCENDHASSCLDGNNAGESECDGPHQGAADGGIRGDAGMMGRGAHYADLDCHRADSHEQAIEKGHDLDCRCMGNAAPARDAGAPPVAPAGGCITNADRPVGQSCINSACQSSTLPTHP